MTCLVCKGLCAPLGQRLLLIDAHVEEDGLHPQQHAALDLSGQGVEEGAGQRDPHIKPVAGKQWREEEAGLGRQHRSGGRGSVWEGTGSLLRGWAGRYPRGGKRVLEWGIGGRNGKPRGHTEGGHCAGLHLARRFLPVPGDDGQHVT